MNEEKAIAYRLGKEKEEKLRRKEAYLQLAKEEERAKEEEQNDLINTLVSFDVSYYIINLI